MKPEQNERVNRNEWNIVSFSRKCMHYVSSNFAGFIASILVLIKARSLRSLTSRGNVAGQMVARVALTRSRVGRCSFSAVGAPGSLSVLVLSASTGNANGGAGGSSYGASGAGRAGGVASRSKLVAADRAVGAGRITGEWGSLSGRALGARDRPCAARVVARGAV